MKRLICLTICILCLSASPAYGNSAPSYWEGFPYSDVLAVQQDSPITVDSERLIFDFSQSVDGEGWSPTAKVSADYRMTNPTKETLSVQMAFPFVAKLSSLSVPDITVNADHTAIPYDIYIDPEDVYPDGSSGGDFHYHYGAIGNISNQEWTLPGFGPDSKAKLYRFAVSAKQEDRLDLEISFDVDPDRTILIGKGFNGASYSEEGNEKLSAAIWGEIQPEILVLGRDLPLTFEVLTHEGKIADKNRYRLEVTEEPADIKEYLLSTLRESLSKETVDAISDTQLFNLCLHEIDRERRSMGYVVLSDFPAIFDDRIFTLVYQVDFPPGSSRSVSVGYIAEGTMDRRETVTPKYSYTYLLSPAENWADFGSLDVEIITPREAPYIIESSLELSQSGQNRYNARFEGLPGTELTFTLYQKEKITLTDKTRKTVSDLRYFTIFFWPVFFIVLLIIAVFAVRSIIRRVCLNRRPLVWITAILVLIMIFASIGLLSDTGNKTEYTRQEINAMAETWAEERKIRINTESWNTGSFEFNRLIYLSPLSSSTFDYAENRMKGTEFTISDDLFEIDYPDQDDLTIQQPVYARETMTDDMIRAFEKSTMHKVFISEYTEKYRYTIYTNDNHKIHFRLYVLDGQVWLSSYADNTADKSEIVMDLCELK